MPWIHELIQCHIVTHGYFVVMHCDSVKEVGLNAMDMNSYM